MILTHYVVQVYHFTRLRIFNFFDKSITRNPKFQLRCYKSTHIAEINLTVISNQFEKFFHRIFLILEQPMQFMVAEYVTLRTQKQTPSRPWRFTL